MITGDLVRFAKWEDIIDINDFSTTPKTHIGTLVEYNHIMQTSVIFYEGNLVTCRIQLVEKAGKKDLDRLDNRAKLLKP